MKTLTNVLFLALIAFASTACTVDSASPYRGVYSGTESFTESYTDTETGVTGKDSGLQELQIAITESESGDLFVTGVQDGCLLLATDEGEFLQIEGICVLDDDVNDIRYSSRFTGEAALTNSGRLELSLTEESTEEFKYVYDHGFEWEVVETSTMARTFSGKPI